MEPTLVSAVTPVVPPTQKPIHWPTVIQFGLSLASAAFFWSSAAGMFFVGLAVQLQARVSEGTAGPVYLMGAGLALTGFLILPSAVFAFLRLIGRVELTPRIGRFFSKFRPSFLIFLFPLALLLGHLVSDKEVISWLFLPVFHILAIGLPVLWFVYIGQRGLRGGSLQLKWGVMASSLLLSPLLIVIFELLVLIGFFFLVGVYLATRPELLEELNNLIFRLSMAPQVPEVQLRILRPYLENPAVIISAFTYIAVIVPVIEEIFKPLAIWLLAGRRLTPQAGFVAGLMAGAAYALFESLVFAANTAQWSYLVSVRAGTGIIHITTTALTGWALAHTWRGGSYLRLALAFLTSVLIHGAWNALTIHFALTQFKITPASGFLTNLGQIAPAALVVLAVLCFVVLIMANTLLRRSASPPGENSLLPGQPLPAD